MIQEIKVKNFLSFKDEVTFSFEATRDTFAEDYQVMEVAPGVRLLHFAMIYGANASGKSNEQKLLEDRELRNFEKVLRALISEDADCRQYVEIETEK